MRKFTTSIAICLLFSFISTTLMAQDAALDAAINYISANKEKLGLTAADIQDYVVSDQYQNKKNKATYIYLRQRYQSIEVYNAILNLTLDKDNNVIFAANRYVSDLQNKVNGTTPAFGAVEAVKKAATALDITLDEEPEVLETLDTREFVLSQSGISLEKIPVKLMYQPLEDGTVKLVWDLSIYTLDAQNWWSVRVDANTGELLDKANWVTHCQHGSYVNQDRLARNTHAHHNCAEHHADHVEKSQMMGTYKVFAMPLESPIHGNRTSVVDPDDPVASPFGWHDTDGATGAEYTITRGNNVHAYLDTADNNVSLGDEPDGGSNLVFDYPLNLNLEPSTYRDATVTNLFYWNNIIHDVWYQYGFDEASGNFQSNNYGNGGSGNDYVRAEAQDGSGTNNANFATPPDGSSGRMQMFLWNNDGGDVLTVNNGAAAAGYEATPAGFGGTIDTIGVTGDLAIVDDGTFNGSEGCNALINGNDINGKIAVIDRGSCEFGVKCLNAQNAGAIAVIVCNNQPGLVTMAAGAVGGQVTIPAVFIDQADCQTIRVTIQAGTAINATIKNPNSSGPSFIDADLDNGVIVHEFGHGISTRLSGGPNNSGCLSNVEQQGEGWSDWFALVMTVEPGDVGTDKRGMGVYSAGQDVDGRGIRSTPFSTDMTINPKTLSNVVIESIPHGLGSVWASMIWDMYWRLVDQYGFDPDIYNGTGGNNMAMQLVIDGLKMQACNPTFEDARDAIFAADILNYNGANECLLWEVFANRGLGFSSSSGSNSNAYDFVEAFDVPLSCNNNIAIVKTAPRTVQAGGTMTYTLDLINHSADTLTNVTLTDTLAGNLTYISGTSSCAATTGSGQVVTINVGTMFPGATQTCTFDVAVAFSPSSSFTYIDSVEDATISNLEWLNVNTQGSDNWTRVQTNPNSGDWSWYIPNPDAQSDVALTSLNAYTISGTRPALRFFHNFDIEPGTDAGLVEISTDFSNNWADVGRYAVSGIYRGPVNSGGLTIAPGRSGFYGSSNGYQETVIDLTNFIGQDLYFRFRMVSDDNASNDLGWYVDDISLIDLEMTPNVAYTTNDQSNNSSGEVAEGGTIIMPSTTSTDNLVPELDVDVFPNPADDAFNIRLGDAPTGEMNIRVIGTDGRVYVEQFVQNVTTNETLNIDIKNLAAGVYFIELNMESGVATRKLVVQK